MKRNFPSPPHIRLVEENAKITPEDGFLRVCRGELTFYYPNGEKSEPFVADRVVRRGDDAVVIVAFYRNEGELMVYLRSAIRPAVALRNYRNSKILEDQLVGNFWELPAGCIDKGEEGLDGIIAAGVRESKEELGFDLKPEEFFFLGKRIFSSVGICGERLFFVAVEVDPKTRTEPTLDGGPFEREGVVEAFSQTDLVEAIRDGYLIDSKTEIGLRRIFD